MREGGRETSTDVREKHRSDLLPLAHTLIRDWTCTPGTCPDRELTPRPLALQHEAQPTEPHWSVLVLLHSKINEEAEAREGH